MTNHELRRRVPLTNREVRRVLGLQPKRTAAWGIAMGVLFASVGWALIAAAVLVAKGA